MTTKTNQQEKHRLAIEWRHVPGAWGGCARCTSTGEAITGMLPQLGKALGAQGIDLHYTESTIPSARQAESNQVLFNGQPVEELLGLRIGESACGCDGGCACSTGQGPLGGDGACRTLIEEDGTVHEALSAPLLTRAATVATGVEVPAMVPDACGQAPGCC